MADYAKSKPVEMEAQTPVDVHRLEAELDYKIYPGTEVMKDVGELHFAQTKAGVLVPQPSNHPNDPLNWSPFWKTGAITCATLVGFAQGFGPLSLSPQFPKYIEEFHSSLEDVIRFVGIAILILGFSNFFWVPVATQFGRRTCFITSCLVCLASMIWRACAKSYGSFLGASILNGFGAGPAETLPPMIVTDVTFLHNRGFYMGLYWWGYFGSLMVGPIIAGPMADTSGWRSFWWLNVAMFGFLIVLALFLLPETKWERAPVLATVQSHEQPNKEANGQSTETEEHAATGEAEVHRPGSLVGKGRPAKWQFMPIQKFSGSKESLMRDIVTPWVLFAFPIMEWSSFVVSWSCSCFLSILLTQSMVFSAPPYNWSVAEVGFTNFAVLVGATLGLATAGPLSDLLSKWSTKRNNNIREPEMRIPAIFPFAVILAIGSSVVCVGYANSWHWPIIVVIGYGCIGWQVAAIPPLAITYSVDSYKPVSGEFLVSMTVNKNLWGYGVSEFLVPWIEKAGFITPFMVNTGMTIGFTLVPGVLLWLFGKKLRGLTKNSYVHRLNNN